MNNLIQRGLAAVLCLSVLPIAPARGAAGAACGGLSATIVGTDANDRFTGTAAADVIVGLAGRDVIDGADGDDVICGGGGNDRLLGASGRDVLRGQSGADSLFGHGDAAPDDSAADSLLGGSGGDSLNYSQCIDFARHCPQADGGDDDIRGGRGRDYLAVCDDGQGLVRGGRGIDGALFCTAVSVDLGTGLARFESGGEVGLIDIENLYGSPWQSDTLIGDDGPNFIYSGFDGEQSRGVPDDLRGGGGRDFLIYGDQDTVAGNEGSDSFLAGIPSDNRGFAALSGGDGSDRFLLCFGASGNVFDGADFTVSGGTGADVVEFGLEGTADLQLGTAVCSDFSAVLTGIEDLQGSSFNDTLKGDDSDNTISGGSGDDVLEGRGGRDTLDGGAGTDNCTSGETVRACEG
jgi:Ca2+-binding RTX toxin-like protein